MYIFYLPYLVVKLKGERFVFRLSYDETLITNSNLLSVKENFLLTCHNYFIKETYQLNIFISLNLSFPHALSCQLCMSREKTDKETTPGKYTPLSSLFLSFIYLFFFLIDSKILLPVIILFAITTFEPP